MHRQRIGILVGLVVMAIGCFVPWGMYAGKQVNAFDHAIARIVYVVLGLAIAALAVTGKRAARIDGVVLGVIVIEAAIIIGLTIVIVYSVVTRGVFQYQLSAGPYVVIGGALVVVIAGLRIGRVPPASVGGALSDWNRR